jgi:multiple sugar transport system permease protein
VKSLFGSERREPAPDSGFNPPRNGVYRLAIHLALIAGALIFAMPFFWMFSFSLKEDDEQMTDKLVWFPRLPPYQPCSPYLDKREGTDLARPAEVSAKHWAELLPAAAAELDERLAACKFASGFSPSEEGRLLLRASLWNTLLTRLPATAFSVVPSMRAAIIKHATPEQLGLAQRRLYRALALGDISLRGEGQSEERFPARSDNPPNGELLWKLAPPEPFPGVSGDSVSGDTIPIAPNVSGDTIPIAPQSGHVPRNFPETSAELRQNFYEGQPEEELWYRFTHAKERMAVRACVPFQGEPKVAAIGLKTDASWNRLWVALEFKGRRYETVEPLLLAGQGRLFSEVLCQLPSPADQDDLRIRDWLVTKEVYAPNAHNRPDSVLVELAVENTSFAAKLWDKALYNYRNALRYIPFWRYFFTSLLLVAVNVVLAVFSSSLAAYSFARLNWPGRELCWAALLGTLMIPTQVTMIPTFLIIKWLGWYNTLRPLWIGSAFGGVFFIFMLRQFMKNIPKDLEDAARIDGCGYWQIYWYVILPLVKPTLAAIGIFTFMNVWNDFMGPLMYLSDQKLYPLSLGLFAFQTIAGDNQGMMMAASLMMTLPVIALFFVAQKQFIQGVTFTGIKG